MTYDEYPPRDRHELAEEEANELADHILFRYIIYPLVATCWMIALLKWLL